MADSGGLSETGKSETSTGAIAKRRRNLSNKSGADKIRKPHSRSPKRRAATPEPEKRVYSDESEKDISDIEKKEVRRRVRTVSDKQSTGSQTQLKNEVEDDIDDFEIIRSLHKSKKLEDEAKEEENRKADINKQNVKAEMKREVKEMEMPPLIMAPPTTELRKRRPNTLPVQKSYDDLEKPKTTPRSKSRTRSRSAHRKVSTSEEEDETSKLALKGKLTLKPKAISNEDIKPEPRRKKEVRQTERPTRRKKRIENEAEETDNEPPVLVEPEEVEELKQEEPVPQKKPWFFQRWFSGSKVEKEVKEEVKTEELEVVETPQSEEKLEPEVFDEPEEKEREYDLEEQEVWPEEVEKQEPPEKKKSAKGIFSEWKQFVNENPKQYKILMSQKNRCISSLIIIIIYCGLGGFMFRFTEGAFESFYKCGVKRVKRDFIDSLWNSATYMREEDWKSQARRKLMEFENQLHTAHEAGVTTYSGQRSWSFLNAVLYCLTVVTTIGYGHISPSTTTGRAITIIYAIFGIPMFLILLADFGKLFTRGIKFIWAFVRRLYYTGSCRKVRKTEAVQEVMKGVQLVYDFAKNRRPSQIPPGEEPDTLNVPIDISQLPDTPGTPLPSTFEVDDEFNLPISVAITILLIYIIVGALTYCFWEEWGFFESFYFVFISMSTIGFGDFVPQHEMYMMASIVYLIFGLALTSMCINVVQEKLSDTFRQASSKIGATIGLKIVEEQQQQQQQQVEATDNSDSNEATNV